MPRTRKTEDDPAARTAAAEMVEAKVFETNGGDVVAVFDAAEFETTETKAGGTEVKLRRVVLTGPWEVAPK